MVRPLSGGGLVAHAGGLLLACDAADDVADRLLQALWAAAGDGRDPDAGRALIRNVAQVLAGAMATSMAACAVAGPADGGAAVLVSGNATATVSGGEGELTLGGQTALTWTDRFVSGPVGRIELRLPTAGQAHPRARLDAGVVPGGGLQWLADPAGAAAPPARPAQAAHPAQPAQSAQPAQPAQSVQPAQPAQPHEQWQAQALRLPEAPTDPRREAARAGAPAAPPAPQQADAPTSRGMPPVPDEPVAGARAAAPGDIPPEDIRSQPFESVLLVQPPDAPAAPAPPPRTRIDPEPDSRPEVWGGDCKNGHFNDPRAHYCGVCGIAMGQLTVIPRRGPRPPLGVLLLDDGMALRLDTDYVMGRDPERAEPVTAGKARPARVDDQGGSVSRRHLHVMLQDWDVMLVDLGSVNGTYVIPPGESEYQQIPAGTPFQIWPGTMVRLGASRSFRYESHRKR
ncbi:FHA domain-containing protein [Thermomonospora amylolytica]|uniref:FHA domain-containing protein n=1 Tax=Thermomonospora amylolytica TaxID=1411117 RepID=UPI000E6C242E|nr:FHA domain-containing protein [Thermomonospora amylolytica]